MKPRLSTPWLHLRQAIPQARLMVYTRPLFARSITTTMLERPTDRSNRRPVLDFSKPLSEVWIEYCSRVEKERKLTERDCLLLCSRIKKAEGEGADSIRQLQAVLREIHRRGMSEETFVRVSNMLIHLFIQRNDLKSAKLVLDGMVRSKYRPDAVTVRTLTGGILSISGSLPEIHALYEMLQEHKMWPEVPAAYKMLISIFGSRGLIDNARMYFSAYLRKRVAIDESVFNAMMLAHGNAGHPEGALAIYKQMRKQDIEPTSATYHILINILKQYGKLKKMNRIYADMKASGVKMNGSHFTAMGRDPKEAIKELEGLEMSCSTLDFNSFILHYTKKNQLVDALDVFQIMKEKEVQPNVFSYSLIFEMLVKDREWPVEDVFSLFDEMRSQGIKPNVAVYTSLVAACARMDDLDKANGLLSEMEEDRLMPNVSIFNSILGILSHRTTNGSIDKRAARLWDKMNQLNIDLDTRSYNIYLSILSKAVRPLDDKPMGGLWKTDGRDAVEISEPVKDMLDIYRSMRRTCRRDYFTYATVINTLIESGQLRQAMHVYSDAKLTRTRLPLSVYNSVMKALEQSGQMSQIMTVWHDMKSVKVSPDNDSYTYALDACLRLGLREALASIRAERRDKADRLLELSIKKDERIEESVQQTAETHKQITETHQETANQ